MSISGQRITGNKPHNVVNNCPPEAIFESIFKMITVLVVGTKFIPPEAASPEKTARFDPPHYGKADSVNVEQRMFATFVLPSL